MINVDGSPVFMPTHVGWTTYAKWQKRPGVGWVFVGYTTPRFGRVIDAVREMQSRPTNEFAWNGLLVAKDGAWWKA